MQIQARVTHIILTFLFSFATLLGFNQTVFTVDGEESTVEEFKRMYEKSQVKAEDRYTQESINEYVNLFLKYKLKLKQASALGLDKDPKVLREIAKYEDQLVRNEFDQKVMNKLINEAEIRLQEEICMRHILIDIPNRYKGTADTIYSYRQALKVRDRIIAGESFEEVAKKTSRDIDTKYTGGDLGCFTALQLKNYALESEAYKLYKGQISMPVRTHLGYHIIEVTDRRPSNGFVSAKQIFIRSNNSLEKEQQEEAELLINAAYAELLSGASFDELGSWIKEQTNLQSSIDLIPEFMVGSYESTFENGIFSLRTPGDFSNPIKTSLGWHIFQLVERTPLPPFSSIEGSIRDKITEDERYAKARLKFGEEIKTKYKYEQVDSVFNDFRRNVAPGISIDGWLTPSSFNYNQTLFKIEDRVFTAQQFVNFVREEHSIENYHSFETYYTNFETLKLMDYHKHNLVKTDPEMKHLMREFRDGIILFNMMEREFWNEASANDTEVEAHYKKTIDKYSGGKAVKVDVYTLDNIELADKVKELLKKDNLFTSINKLEKKQKITIPKTQISLAENQSVVKDVDLWNLGSIVMRKTNEGKWEVLKSREIIEGNPQPFSEVKMKVLTDYQKTKEEEWINGLKEKFSVSVNEKVIQSLIK